MSAIDLAEAPAAAPERAAHRLRLLCILFFFSGFPALIYQLVWQRALFRIFGVNIESVTIVVTAFMLGLGLGSLAGGWLSRRRGIPLLPLLAGIELAIAAFGLISLSLFDSISDTAIALPLPLSAALALLLVIVPTLLMGATLPVLVAHFVRRSGNVGSSVGRLYYANTLGAGAACLACTVLLFPFLGLQASVYVAVAMNIAVAAGAMAAYSGDRRRPADNGVVERASPSARPAALKFPYVVALAAAGGFVSLSYEIFFFRTVSYATGSSASAFAATLSAFLVGLAAGSRRAGEVCATASCDEAVRAMVTSLVIANALGLAFLPVLSHLAWLGDGLVGVAMLLVYLMARYWGALLPYLAQLGIAADDRSGMHTGLLYLANIVGSASGGIVTGFVLMQYMSLRDLAVALVALGIACAIMVAVNASARRLRGRAVAAAALAIAAVAIAAMLPLSAGVLERLQWKGAASAKGSFVTVIENRSGIITVDRDDVVYGNGMYDGRFNTGLVHDTNGIVRPYALSLFHPAPRDVLMIGLSSGSWAQVIANNPAVRSLTVVEINPGYRALVAAAPEVASVLTNPKVRVVAADGRRWLRRAEGRRFDAIVSNTTWHFRAHVTNLLSAEFLGLVKQHLRDGGVFFYNTTDSARVQRTGCVGFAHGARFTNHMVVSDLPIAWDFARWRETLLAYRIDGRPVFDLARSEDRAALDRLLAMQASLAGRAGGAAGPLEPCPSILARTAGEAIVTDDNMGSEWRHALGLR